MRIEMTKKLLLLGGTGKVGSAINEAFSDDDKYKVISKNSKDFDGADFDQVKKIVVENKPDILVNAVAFLGIDSCEKYPDKAFRLNSLYPKQLAELSSEFGFLLIHFSTDSVFNSKEGGFFTEDDVPCPLNVYGLTKHRGDCFIQAKAKKYYVFRLPLIFGKTTKNNQFIEKMIQKTKEGQKVLRVADDIISSPTYSKDVAKEARRIIEEDVPFGLYHIANNGYASLYELIIEVIRNSNLDVKVERASYKDFPFVGRKNLRTPLKSNKIKALRHWRDSVSDYCKELVEEEDYGR